jgi:ATP-binding cassette subfamily B protein
MVGMLLLSWQLALFAFALIPIFVLLTRRVGNERRKIAKTTQETLADISSLVQESLSVSGIMLGKTMGRTSELADRFESDSLRLADLEVRQRMAGRWVMASIQTTFAVMPAAVYWFGGLRSRRFRRSGSRHWSRSRPADPPLLPDRACFGRPDVRPAALFDRIEYRPAGRHRGEARRVGREAPGRAMWCPTTPAPLRRRMDARGHHVHVPAGTTTALAGETGSQRRSAISPLACTTERGAVIGGVDARRSQLPALSDLVGVVSQGDISSTHLCARTFALWPDARRELEAARRAARIHDLIESPPEGYDTASASAAIVSGGEKQRMAIARTILRNPPILARRGDQPPDTETDVSSRRRSTRSQGARRSRSRIACRRSAT